VSSSDQVERELKLGAWPEFVLPDLDDARNGVKPGPATRTELDAVYFDTADLHLLRRGVTLRFRSGEAPGDVWTVKLPSDAAERGLARRELTVPGKRDAIPGEFADVTRGWALGRRLQPVARVHTSRVSVPLCDEGGQALATLDDDSVTVRRGRRVVARFRELEVELAPTTSPDLLAAVDERLHTAGAEKVPQIPKLSRALGRDGAQPWQLASPVLSSKPTLAEAAHVLLAKAAAELVDLHAPLMLGAGGAARDLRAAVERLRAAADLVAQFAEASPAAAIAEGLAWLDAEVTPVADLDPVIARLRQAHAAPGVTRESAVALSERAATARRRAHARLARVLRDARYTQLLRRLEALAVAPPVGTRAGGRRVASGARKHVRAVWRSLRDAPAPEPNALAALATALDLARTVPAVDADTARERIDALAAAIAEHDEGLVVAARLRALARGRPAADAWAAGVLAGRELARADACAARVIELWEPVTQKATWSWTE
jgi:inorganic triphosphatase YgiF